MTQFEAIVRLTNQGTKPIKAYSPAYGWVTIKDVFVKDDPYHYIRCEMAEGNVIYFTRDLMLTGAGEHAKQMLFPNRECEDWVKYINRTKPELKFYVDELIAYVKEPNHNPPYESDVFILARIMGISDKHLIVKDNLLSCVRTIDVKSAYKLKDAAKILHKRLSE